MVSALGLILFVVGCGSFLKFGLLSLMIGVGTRTAPDSNALEQAADAVYLRTLGSKVLGSGLVVLVGGLLLLLPM